MMTDFATLEDLQQADPLFQEIQRLRAALDECYSLSSQGDGEELLELIYEISKQALEQECEPESLQQEAR
jgi:hypothetical protein